MTHIKKFWAVYGALIMAGLPYALPVVTSYIAAHPRFATDLSALAVILAKISKSPSQVKS